MECPKCGNEVRDSEKTCPFCKKVLQLECPVCHKFNRSSVCEECGHVIIQKCHNCGTPGPNTGKCRKCGFDTAKSVIMNEAETEEYACLAITFPNIEDLRPALKNKQIFNKFKKKLKQALFGYAASQDNRAQLFGETYVIKYYKEFSFTSSVKKAVKSAIELLNKIGGISFKLKRSKNVRLHCKMTILKKTFETDNNEFNTGLNIKLIKDTTEEKYTDGLQLITDQYVNNIMSRDYTLEMIYSSQVGDELLMFYEFPLEDQIIPIVIEDDKAKDNSILKGPKELPKLKIYDDDDKLEDILYGNKAIDISTEGQFLSVPAHNIFNTLNEIMRSNVFVTLKTTERRDLPTKDICDFLKTKSTNVLHVVCKENFKYQPYTFFRELFAKMLHIDLKQKGVDKIIASGTKSFDSNGIFANLLNNTPSESMDPDTAFITYVNSLREFISSQKHTVVFIEGMDMIDETSLRVLNDYISSLINVEDLSVSFVVTVRSDYSVYKNIPKLLHSPFYKEINVTKGDYEEFLATLPENIDEIKNSFYIQKLEERSAGSLTYFKNFIQYLRDSNVFITFEGKLMINAEKTLVFPGTIQELLTKRFTSLPESEGLVVAYTILLGGSAHISLLEKLNIENLSEAIESLSNKSLIQFDDSIVEVENLRIFKQALLKALEPSVKKTLVSNIEKASIYNSYELLDFAGKNTEKLARIYEVGMNSLFFGDFNSYLNCSKVYFTLIEELGIKDEEFLEKKNELYSILVNHLNRYPSTKVYSISKSILANATSNNDDETIVNVSNLVLDSALNGGDYVLAQQCIQNILTRILNPKLLAEGQDYTPQFILYSCIHAKIAFHLSHYNQCISVCEKIISTLTPEFLDKISADGVDKTQFMSYIMEILVFSALSRIIICDGSIQEFLDSVKERLGHEILSNDYLLILNKLLHKEEYDIDAGIPNDVVSMFLSGILQAFRTYGEGYNVFAQNIYKAKLAVQGENLQIFSLLCDLFIGYSYQKSNLENPVSWKKCEKIYEDVYFTAQKSGYADIVQLTNWFKASLLKDKEIYEEAYELIVSVTNNIKRKRIKNRLLMLVSYILTLNIACKLEALKEEIPVLVYRITYLAERYNLEEYYNFIDDQRVLDTDYMKEFKEAIIAEKEAIAAEREEEAKADAQEEEIIQEGGVPQES